ncbi:MAG: hypothetical protein ABUS56_12675 [Acidobacteriota bacterium]
MATVNDERRLWAIGDVECVMLSCCAGAELQLRRTTPAAAPTGDTGATIVLRELYPMKSDLYERARQLEAEHRGPASAVAP